MSQLEPSFPDGTPAFLVSCRGRSCRGRLEDWLDPAPVPHGLPEEQWAANDILGPDTFSRLVQAKISWKKKQQLKDH